LLLIVLITGHHACTVGVTDFITQSLMRARSYPFYRIQNS